MHSVNLCEHRLSDVRGTLFLRGPVPGNEQKTVHFSIDKECPQIYITGVASPRAWVMWSLLVQRIYYPISGSASGRKYTTIWSLRVLWLKRAATPKVMPPSQHPTSNNWLMSGPEPRPLTPTQENSKGSPHLQTSLHRWLRCSLETTLPLDYILCPTLFPSLPFPRCWYQKHFSINPLYVDLHLEVCFLGSPSKDSGFQEYSKKAGDEIGF